MKKALAIRRMQSWGLAAALAVMTAAPSFAQTTPSGPDYGGMVEGAKTELTGAMTTVGPIVFGILGILAAIAFAWKFFKKGAKSS